MPTAHQEQFGVQYLAQGQFDTQLRGAKIQTSDRPITRRPALPPEIQLPHDDDDLSQFQYPGVVLVEL